MSSTAISLFNDFSQGFTQEYLRGMPDDILANYYSQIVLLADKVITAREPSGYAKPEQVGELYDRLSGEIAARGKHWAPLIFGGAADLAPGVGTLLCACYIAPTRRNGDYFPRICRREDSRVNESTRRIRCTQHSDVKR